MTGALVTVQGRMTADAELRYTQNGIPVANFTVAHTPRKRGASGEWEDAGEPLFLRVTVWREHGENLAQSLHKGDELVVIGRLLSRTYETREGEKRTTVELEADVVAVDLRRQRAVVQRQARAAAATSAAPAAVAA